MFYVGPMAASDAVAEFRRLYETGCFLMPNPWDVGGARFPAQLGVKALATTSAGFAFREGRPDTPTALAVDDVLAHVREIVQATELPVNVDSRRATRTTPTESSRTSPRVFAPAPPDSRSKTRAATSPRLCSTAP